MPAERIVGLGAGAVEVAPDDPAGRTDDVITLGPHHPSAHGVLRLRLRVSGDERIEAAEPLVGYLHRGAEKLFEVRDYRQIIVLANRHDWLSAFANELGVVLAAERMLGMDVPVRAVWARTLLAELNRALSHLLFLGGAPGALVPARQEPLVIAVRLRDRLQEVMEELAGGRIHYMLNRVGGLRADLPAGWLERVGEAVAGVRAGLDELEDRVLGDPAVRAAYGGAGVLSAAAVLGYGVSGPPARASGLAADLRRDAPYLGYGELDVPVVTRTAGDALARLEVLAGQLRVSLDLADACAARLAGLPDGPVNLRLPKVLRLPEGATYVATENPLGLNGYYLVSRGGTTPWRLKLRSASFNNVQVLRELLVGARVVDLPAILASLFYVTGDLDK